MQSGNTQGCLPLFLFAVFVVLFPLFLADVMITALGRLGLSPRVTLLAAMGIFIGGMINIPVRRIERNQPFDASSCRFFGLQRFFADQTCRQQHTVLAVNVGGCVIPCAIAAYELFRIAGHGPGVLGLALTAVGINVFICYHTARPVANVGIAMPALVPAIAAAACALLLYRELAPPIAFCAGVLGPLIGADLLHLKEIEKLNTGVASIGGAGTFDGIVLSGLLATLLA
ncbi:MAG: DUF1614 domain-containing protein [Desulfosalsimonas sp.]|uniref:DUF1614 domain-containing protein n=1 Tax=Desulfosalsimonas sp. TaxID=3073848 RepID=UPI003970F84A